MNIIDFFKRKKPTTGSRKPMATGLLFDQTSTDGIKYNKYKKDVRGIKFIDVYMVCSIFGVDDPSGAVQHAIKKLLNLGSRGYKSRLQDLIEARDTLDRAIEIEEAKVALEQQKEAV